jgi:hypothetical protein
LARPERGRGGRPLKRDAARRAEAFIAAYAGKAIALADVASVAGVCPRSLREIALTMQRERMAKAERFVRKTRLILRAKRDISSTGSSMGATLWIGCMPMESPRRICVMLKLSDLRRRL